MMIGNVWMQLAATCSGTLVFFILGCIQGWPSPSLPPMKSGKVEPHITSDEESLIISFMTFGQLLSTLPAGYMADYVGRKVTLLSAFAPFIVSWALISVGQSVAVLYTARFFAGLGVGITATVGPMYMGEIAQNNIRGALGTVFQLMINLGILYEYSIGPFVSPMTLGILSAIIPVIFIATFMWMPESPYYYLIKNRRIDAEHSLLRLRGVNEPEDVQKELDEMEQYVEINKQNKGGIKDLFFDRGSRKALIIVMSLIVVQNLSGIFAFLSYSTEIFKESKSSIDANLSVIIMGIVQVVLSLVASALVDIAGRRVMLLVSSVGSTVALAAEGLYYYLLSLPDSDVTSLYWLPITAMVFYLIVYTLGLGPLPTTLMGELFPTNVKGIASSFGCITIGVAAFVTIKLFQVAEDTFGIHVVFWFFAASSLAGTVFIAVFVPETKGKSFTEISDELANKKFRGSRSFEVWIPNAVTDTGTTIDCGRY